MASDKTFNILISSQIKIRRTSYQRNVDLVRVSFGSNLECFLKEAAINPLKHMT